MEGRDAILVTIPPYVVGLPPSRSESSTDASHLSDGDGDDDDDDECDHSRKKIAEKKNSAAVVVVV